MREMVFNEASTVPQQWPLQQATAAIVDIAKGMAALVGAGCTPPILRMQHQMHEITIATDGSLWDAILLLRHANNEREATLFWMRLAQKMPLLADLPTEIVDRFQGCEPAVEHGRFGEALVLCAHRFGIAISLPSQAGWDTDRLTVRFNELLPDGEVMASSEQIDNLARSSHADPILVRDREHTLDQLSFETFWTNRAKVFPSLRFGLDVEQHIEALGGNLFGTIKRRLADLERSAAKWLLTGGGAPDWTTHVTPESQTLLNSPLRGTRVFRDSQGGHRLYEWHARFGSSGRIHLRFDPTDKSVEIGYIGPHLPLS